MLSILSVITSEIMRVVLIAVSVKYKLTCKRHDYTS